MDEILCLPVVAENPVSDRKGQSVVTMKQRQQRLVVSILDAFKKFFVGTVGRLGRARVFVREGALPAQERQIEHSF